MLAVLTKLRPQVREVRIISNLIVTSAMLGRGSVLF